MILQKYYSLYPTHLLPVESDGRCLIFSGFNFYMQIWTRMSAIYFMENLVKIVIVIESDLICGCLKYQYSLVNLDACQ